MTNEVKKNEDFDVTVFDVEGVDSGFEGTTLDSFKTPFLKILQDLSPEIKQNSSRRIPEAEIGMFYNTATGELSKEVNIIVLKVVHSIIAWKPDRGGFVWRYHKSEEDDIVAERDGLKKWDANGNELMDTMEFFCVNANDYTDMFVFPLSSTSLKYARNFNSRLRALKHKGKQIGVTWAGVWNIRTVEDRDGQHTWFTIGETPDFQGFITKEIRDTVVFPSLEKLKTAVADYSIMDEESESVVDDDAAQF